MQVTLQGVARYLVACSVESFSHVHKHRMLACEPCVKSHAAVTIKFY